MHKAVAEALQAMWKENLGVDVNITNQESKVFMDTRAQGDYQLARASWIADYIDPMTFLDVFADDENDAQYHNPAYNALIAKAKASNDERQRMAYLHEAEQMLFDDCVIILVLHDPALRGPALYQGLPLVAAGTGRFQESLYR